MPQALAHVTFLVRDYDEALAFFTESLGFRVVENTPQPANKRWILIAPPGSQGANLLLARAATPEQLQQVGNQAGGRVCFFLTTDDFWRDYRLMLAANVKFLESPRQESYGTVAVFEDLYGNKWDLLQPADHTIPRQRPRESP
jgi:catechol 2,3-dioxygenase-like lactoylglutathione lyase family enzyme